jgi:hypothetical protein
MKQGLMASIFMFCAAVLTAADLTGTWSANVALDVGSGTAVFKFTQSGEMLTGSYTGTFGESKVTGTVKGNQVEFSFDADQAGKVVYKGTLEGTSKMKGSCEYGALGKGTFTAEKK